LPWQWLTRWRAARRARQRALALAEDLGRRLRPGEPIWGVALRAEEDARYVVRVYCGDGYKPIARTGPPWRECLIIAVSKDGQTPAQWLEDAGPYRPVIR
jgi:hypothetical protein